MTRLTLAEELCNGCKKCEQACPEQAITFFGGLPNFCRQCPDPECADACPNSAIEFRDGLVQVDPKKCDGCKKCADACPYRAISITDTAHICSLCHPDSPKCIPICPTHAFTLSKEKTHTPLPWSFQEFSPSICKKKIQKTKNGIIFTDKNHLNRYFYTALSTPTPTEFKILKTTIEIFKEFAREDLLNLPITKTDPFQSRIQIKSEAERVLMDYLHSHTISLPPARTTNLIKILTATVGGNLGPLDFLIYDDMFEEIIYNGAGPLIVKSRQHGRLHTNLFLNDPEYAKENIVNKIAEYVGEPNLSERNPILPATLPNNDRLHALHKPVVDSIAFTIRHFPRNPITLSDMIPETLSRKMANYLIRTMQQGKTLFIIGATGTGKTTLLNALLQHIPLDRRILSLEEVREIHPPHQDFLPHSTRRSQGILLHHLIESSLRETPDRVVIGEVRTSEDIRAFLELAQAGPGEGSYATFHGETLETAINRLKHHGIAACDLSGAIHTLVLLKRKQTHDKKTNHTKTLRYIAEIAELQDDATLKKVFTQ